MPRTPDAAQRTWPGGRARRLPRIARAPRGHSSPPDRGRDLLGIEAGRDVGPEVGQLEGRRRDILAFRQLGRRAATPDRIDGSVVDDREDPRLDAAPILDVATGIAPDAEEGVLNHVL